jgi:CheY-like chemotaxis protein
LHVNIPVIALTANATKEDQDRFLHAGMNGYLSKPYKKEDLFALIKKLTHKSYPTPELNYMPYSLNTIRELASGDSNFVASIVQSFIVETPVKLQAISKGIQNRDPEPVAFQTHQLKSMVDILEIHATSSLVKQMDREVKKELIDWQLIEKLFSNVELDIKAVIENLKELNNKSGL